MKKILAMLTVCIGVLIAMSVSISASIIQPAEPIDRSNKTIEIEQWYNYGEDGDGYTKITSSQLEEGELVFNNFVYKLDTTYGGRDIQAKNNYNDLDPDPYFETGGKKYAFHFIGSTSVSENEFDPEPEKGQWIGTKATYELVPAKEPEDVAFTGEETLTVYVDDDVISNQGVTADDNGTDVSHMIDGEKVDTSKPATYTYSWTIQGRSGNAITFTRQIVVKAKESGEVPGSGEDLKDVVFAGEKTLNVYVGDVVYSNQGITANDNGEDVTHMIGGVKVDTSKPIAYEYTWTIKGSNGNEVTFERTIIVNEKEPAPTEDPEEPGTELKDVVFSGAKTLNVYVGDKVFSNQGLTADDNGTDVTSMIEGKKVDTSKPAVFTYTWSIWGSNGNQVDFKRTITVLKKETEKTDDTKKKVTKVTTTATIKGVGKISASTSSGKLYNKKGKIIAKHAKGAKVTFKAHGKKFKYWQKKVGKKWKKYSKKRTIKVKDKTNTAYRAVFKK